MAEIKVDEAEAIAVFQGVAKSIDAFTAKEADMGISTSSMEFIGKVTDLETTYRSQIQAYIEALKKIEQESESLIKTYGEKDAELAKQF